jgi:hypothetical protein
MDNNECVISGGSRCRCERKREREREEGEEISFDEQYCPVLLQ